MFFNQSKLLARESIKHPPPPPPPPDVDGAEVLPIAKPAACNPEK
jgi:hypothetical protein